MKINNFIFGLSIFCCLLFVSGCSSDIFIFPSSGSSSDQDLNMSADVTFNTLTTTNWSIIGGDLFIGGDIVSISGTLKVLGVEIPCNGGSAGSIYYNATTFKHYGCNSTEWNALY